MTVVSAPPPFRIQFDEARDPYTARNALGIEAGIAALTGDVTTTPPGVATIAADAVTNAKLANMAQATIKGRASGAGTGDPTDLTAAQVGTVIAPAWTAYTPTITAGSGTFTSVSATGKYLTIGKLTHIKMDITITTNGTAAGYVLATLPNTSVGLSVLSGREINTTGKLVGGSVGYISSTTVMTTYYDNIYPGANGNRIIMSGSYENT